MKLFGDKSECEREALDLAARRVAEGLKKGWDVVRLQQTMNDLAGGKRVSKNALRELFRHGR